MCGFESNVFVVRKRALLADSHRERQFLSTGDYQKCFINEIVCSVNSFVFDWSIQVHDTANLPGGWRIRKANYRF